jgi:nicotinamidase-related amidase
MTARTVPGSTPYAWPWHGQLDPRRTVLVVVTPTHGPSLSGSGAGAALSMIARVLRSAGGRVVHVTTLPPPAERDSAPVDLPDVEVDVTLSAAGIDGFYGSSLDAELRTHDADALLLGGVGLETCVHSTMRSANDRGYECLLVLDACVAGSPDLVAASRSQVEMSGGIFGAVGTTLNVLAACAAAPSLTSGDHR